MSSRCCFTLRDKNQFTVYVTIPNCFKSPHRSICFWAFCYWHFCKRRTSGHGAPDPVFPDGVQAQLHQYRLPGAPPVHQQREHLHRGPGRDREGAEVLSLQTRCSEHLLRPVRNGEYEPSGVLAATGVSAILTHPHPPLPFSLFLSLQSLLVTFEVMLQCVSPPLHHAPTPNTPM